MKPAVASLGIASLAAILLGLLTQGLDAGWIVAVTATDLVMAAFLVLVFRLRDYRVAHVPSARAAYGDLLARDKPRGTGNGRGPVRPATRLGLLLMAAAVAPLATGVAFGLVLGDENVPIAVELRAIR